VFFRCRNAPSRFAFTSPPSRSHSMGVFRPNRCKRCIDQRATDHGKTAYRALALTSCLFK
jgi:hypothetical protein